MNTTDSAIEIEQRTSKLPRRLSKLLRVALRDLEEVEKDSRYRVEMGEWHRPSFDDANICEVCFAGAVLARSIGVHPQVDVRTKAAVFGDKNPFFILNELRAGRIDAGLRYSGRCLPCGMKPFRSIPDYATEPNKFKAAMRRLANDLEKRGL